MKNNPFLLLLFCGALFFSACSSDDDDTPSEDEMLQNKRWQITALQASTPFGNLDLYEDFEDCQRDNFVEFKANGVLEVNEGATKCNNSDPQQTQGTWSLSGGVLTISGIGDAYGLPDDDLEITVTSLTSSKLDGEFTESISGISIDGTVTLETM
ncbi:lipocalin-like domain-containing protein [Rufibacter hautae]|uniref:Lipocalin family protein n=1 Tax=Rufibacter hautae TaxID=2595005 RepID=A0A5B6TM25_9BACT|nr:lipocalin family protein [Rufibacter hautae]KAA3440530.1 lipocalin family protein [Rufibacter hautae]